MKQKKFMTAEWRKLIMANYETDPSTLQKYIPAGTELDFWKNKLYISLVGFMFENVRVMGLKIPFHIKFPEVNLRFYVRYKDQEGWKRGVVFISEIVPKPAITFIANKLFHEHYTTMPVRKLVRTDGHNLSVEYKWKKNEKWNSLSVIAGSRAGPLVAGSEEEFITEHFWGYSAITSKKTGEYHVEHPRWSIYGVKDYQIQCDFNDLYGESFAGLIDQKPKSVFLAEGSPVTIFKKRIL